MTHSFQYLRPESVREACELKAEYGQLARFWAGGTDLLLEWQRGEIEIQYCIDISNLERLKTIQMDDHEATIGALATISDLGEFEGFENGYAVLHDVAAQFATPQIRNVATLGGNLCHAVPSADFAAPLIAMDAEASLLGLNAERSLLVEEFFIDAKETALRSDELLVEIRIPHPLPRSACTFERVTRSSVDIALVNAAVQLAADRAGMINQARVALGAVAPVPFRSKRAEEMLLGERLEAMGEQRVARAAERSALETRPITDVRASAAYRRYVSQVLVKRALTRALDGLREG